MPRESFRERDEAGLEDYLAEEIGEGVTRSDLLEGMRRLLLFTREATYSWEDSYFALIYATIVRSARTFQAICLLLGSGLAVQAAMLTRSLFEDVIVAHWMVLNKDEPDWLVERFLRQREAIALHQRRLAEETGFAMGPPIPVSEDVEQRAEALRDEFGKQATADWWDPGKQGKGVGDRVGLRRIVTRLEQAAFERKMFHPRFAGGEEPVLNRFDRVVHKWLSQCIHHTVVGLPFAPESKETTGLSNDPMVLVGFSASWLFAQQVFLLHELNGLDPKESDIVWYACMGQFVKVLLGREAADRFAEGLGRHYQDR